jgi:DNA modification methylase
VAEPFYQDEAVCIYHGDCREVLESVAPFAEHCITDPPYFRDVYIRASLPGTKEGSGTPARTGAGLAKLAAGAIGDADDLCDPIGVLLGALVKRWCLVFSDVENAHKWRLSLERGAMRYVRTGAWVKPDAMPQMSGDRPGVGFEPCTIAHSKHGYDGPMRWNGGGRLAVWTHYISKGRSRPDHPCPKPESLMRELVELFTDPGETVLDPFMGSGTTLVAAKRLGRKAIGIERELKYCELAVERLRQSALPLEMGA